MHIEWNKVTWCSKLMALVLLLGVVILSFYLGNEYGQAVAALSISENQRPAAANASVNRSEPQTRYWVPSGAKTPCSNEKGCYLYTDEKYGYSFKYPVELQAFDIKHPTNRNGIDCLVSAYIYSREELAAYVADNDLPPVANICVLTKETYAGRKQGYASSGYDPKALRLDSGFMLIVETREPLISGTIEQFKPNQLLQELN